MLSAFLLLVSPFAAVLIIELAEFIFPFPQDALLMGELAASWTRGFQFGEAPGGVKDPKFLQGVITLKHFDGESQMTRDERRLQRHLAG